MKNIAIIFAGGVGKRMGSELPKQFLEIYGRPIIVHTLEKFQYNSSIDEIIVACNKEWIGYLEELVVKFQLNKIFKGNIIPGGATGQDSIYNALMKAKESNDLSSVVLIHDGVRPMIDDDTITKNIESVKKYGSAITCVQLQETPVVVKDGSNIDCTLDRNEIFIAKAPQSFFLKDVLEAHDDIRKTNPDYEGIVDTCSLMMQRGMKPKIVEGRRENIKVTTPNDYIDLIAKFSAVDYKNFIELDDK